MPYNTGAGGLPLGQVPTEIMAQGLDQMIQSRLQRRGMGLTADQIAAIGTPEAQAAAQAIKADPDAARVMLDNYGGADKFMTQLQARAANSRMAGALQTMGGAQSQGIPTEGPGGFAGPIQPGEYRPPAGNTMFDVQRFMMESARRGVPLELAVNTAKAITEAQKAGLPSVKVHAEKGPDGQERSVWYDTKTGLPVMVGNWGSPAPNIAMEEEVGPGGTKRTVTFDRTDPTGAPIRTGPYGQQFAPPKYSQMGYDPQGRPYFRETGNQQIGDIDQNLAGEVLENQIGEVIGTLDEAPGSIGAAGKLGSFAGGVVDQGNLIAGSLTGEQPLPPDAGAQVTGAISGASPEQIGRISSLANAMLSEYGKMVGMGMMNTSEYAQAEQVLGGLVKSWAVNPKAAKEVLRSLQYDLKQRRLTRAERIGGPPEALQEGAVQTMRAKIAEYEKQGMTREEAKKRVYDETYGAY